MLPVSKQFPSLFRDSSDHHLDVVTEKQMEFYSFHPSLGIPLIITLCSPFDKKVSFHRI